MVLLYSDALHASGGSNSRFLACGREVRALGQESRNLAPEPTLWPLVSDFMVLLLPPFQNDGQKRAAFYQLLWLSDAMMG